MTDTTARLAAIQAECGKRKDCHFRSHEGAYDDSCAIHFPGLGNIFVFMPREPGLTIAEAFLTATDPDAVRVEIDNSCTEDSCCCRCQLKHCEHSAINGCGENKPGPGCPGPAPEGKEWVLVLRDKEKKR